MNPIVPPEPGHCDVCEAPVKNDSPWCSEACFRKMHCITCDGPIGDNDVFPDGACRYCGGDSGRPATEAKIKVMHPQSKVEKVMAFCRENFWNDGAEGESVHLLCDALEELYGRAQAPPAVDERYRKVTVLRESSAQKFCGELESIHTLEPIEDHKGPRGEHRWRSLDAEFLPPDVKADARGTFTITVEFTPDEAKS